MLKAGASDGRALAERPYHFQARRAAAFKKQATSPSLCSSNLVSTPISPVGRFPVPKQQQLSATASVASVYTIHPQANPLLPHLTSPISHHVVLR